MNNFSKLLNASLNDNQVERSEDLLQLNLKRNLNSNA